MWKPLIALRKHFFLKPKHAMALVRHTLGLTYDGKRLHELQAKAEKKLMIAELRKDFRNQHYYKGMVDALVEVIKQKQQ